MRFIIITGLSGAGKSLAAKYLEDLGFFCVDNLPPALMPKFVEICSMGGEKMDRVALVIDIRGRQLLNGLFPVLDELKQSGFSYEIIFLDASDKSLIKRYKESRRAHPLAAEGRLLKGIHEERRILQQLKNRANLVLDTSNLTPRQLKEEIGSIFLEGTTEKGLLVNIISFGFKYGIPMECDLVFDVRFIPNPYYIESMKKLTGQQTAVRDYVMESSETKAFMEKLMDMLLFLIPNYIKEGKSQLVIGIGCTGGRHRSVAIAEALHGQLLERRHRVFVDHRDIEKDSRGAVE